MCASPSWLLTVVVGFVKWHSGLMSTTALGGSRGWWNNKPDLATPHLNGIELSTASLPAWQVRILMSPLAAAPVDIVAVDAAHRRAVVHLRRYCAPAPSPRQRCWPDCTTRVASSVHRLSNWRQAPLANERPRPLLSYDRYDLVCSCGGTGTSRHFPSQANSLDQCWFPETTSWLLELDA